MAAQELLRAGHGANAKDVWIHTGRRATEVCKRLGVAKGPRV